MNIDEKILDKISANTPEPINETYKGEDGLLRCSKCDGLLETIINFQEKSKKVRCICKCQAKALEDEEQKRRSQEKMRRIDSLRRTGFPDGQLVDWTFENDDNSHPEVMKAAKNYVENFKELKRKGKGLLLYGDVGTGKTYVAACIANALVDKGVPAMVTNFARIANKLQESFDGRQSYLDSLNMFDLLVIDDLATERKTEFMQEIIFNVIDARYRSGLPMIITTNLGIETIKNPPNVSDNRIFDRILEKCFPIEVKGASHRRQNVRDEYEDMKDLLGLN